ncbi:MAG: hypothetical protein WAR81_17310, partial [Pseudomonadales bacterium]
MDELRHRHRIVDRTRVEHGARITHDTSYKLLELCLDLIAGNEFGQAPWLPYLLHERLDGISGRFGRGNSAHIMGIDAQGNCDFNQPGRGEIPVETHCRGQCDATAGTVVQAKQSADRVRVA